MMARPWAIDIRQEVPLNGISPQRDCVNHDVWATIVPFASLVQEFEFIAIREKRNAILATRGAPNLAAAVVRDCQPEVGLTADPKLHTRDIGC